jgi:hypothetical protein
MHLHEAAKSFALATPDTLQYAEEAVRIESSGPVPSLSFEDTCSIRGYDDLGWPLRLFKAGIPAENKRSLLVLFPVLFLSKLQSGLCIGAFYV